MLHCFLPCYIVEKFVTGASVVSQERKNLAGRIEEDGKQK